MPPEFDWSRLHQRLAELETRIGERGRSADAERELLCSRARDLARPPAQERAATLPLLAFRLGEQRYAIEFDTAREVMELGRWSRLPTADPPLAGVVAWRGEILTLYSLAAALGLPDPAEEPRWCVVVGEADASFGIPVTSVDEIAAVDPAALRPPPNAGPAASWIRGVAPDGLLVLDERSLRQLHLSRRA